MNDRNLQRRRESGITIYALIALLLTVLYQALQKFPSNNVNTDIVSFVGLLNCCFNFFAFFYLFIRAYLDISISYSSTTRYTIGKSHNENMPSGIIRLFFITMPFLTNTIFLILSYSIGNFHPGFILIELSYIILLLGYLITKPIKTPDSNTTIRITSDFSKAQKLTFQKFQFILVIAIGYLIYFACTINTNLNKIKIIEFGTLILSVPYIINLIRNFYYHDHYSKSLENLEYEIHAKDLSDAEIRNRLQTKYFGYFLVDWILITTKEIEEFNKKIREEFKEVTKIRLTEIEKDSAEQVAKNIEARAIERLIEYSLDIFYKKKKAEIEDILRNTNLDYSDREKVIDLLNKTSLIAEQIRKELFIF